MPRLALALLGVFQATLDAAPLTSFHSMKVRGLLAFLAVEAERPHARATLATLFWPRDADEYAQKNLRQTLYHLRQLLGDPHPDTGARPPYLLVTRQTVQFNTASAHTLDVAAFLHAIEQGRLAEATALYRGELLAGFTCDSEPFDDWLRLTRQRLHNLAVDAFDQLAQQALAQADFTQARLFAGRQLALEPWREAAHRQLMVALASAGERSAALAQYEICRRLLADELGVEPAAATHELYRQILAGQYDKVIGWQGDANGGRRTVAVTASPPHPVTPAPPHNLPPQLTPFIGRQTELAQIAACLADTTCRLLTLLGPGGIGKTRLAIAAAQAQAETFGHGAAFVPLAPLSSAEFLVAAVAAVLHFSASANANPKEQLLSYLREKALLVVLDNFEHLLQGDYAEAGIDLLLEIMATAPQVKLLVTSRQRLNLPMEWTIEVGGMDFPAAREQDLAGLETYSAVTLFLQRARQTRTGFALSEAVRPDVARICQLVEGMPLGLELAASWVRTLPCQAIVQEIERRLDFLATPFRTVPERHQSLRAVFQHSWQLLAAAEQAVFCKLSVFRGGFTRTAGEQVAGASLLLLSALIDRSLLRPAGERYEIHELLRQYAAEKLQSVPGESQATHAAHAVYYATFLQQREADLKGARQKEALTEIRTEVDNIRASWRWAITHHQYDLIGKALEGFFHYSEMRGAFQEAEATFRQAIAALSQSSRMVEAQAGGEAAAWVREQAILLARLRRGQGWFLTRLGAFGQDQLCLQQSVAGLREVGDAARGELALSLLWLGTAAYLHEEYAVAKPWLRESLAISGEVGDRWGVGGALMILGHIAEEQTAYREAADLLQESIQVFKGLGERRTMGYSILTLGHLAKGLGAYAQAQWYFAEGLTIYEEFDDLGGVAYTLRACGEAAMALGHYTLAKTQIEKSLALCQELGNQMALAKALDSLGSVARLTGAYAEAEQAYQRSLTLCKELGSQRTVAFILSNLGCLAYQREMYALAEQYLQESLAICAQADFPREQASAWRYLGYVAGAAGRGRGAEAWQYFQQALAIATKLGAVPLSLDVLVGLAMLLAGGEAQHQESAIVWLTLVQDHPASECETKAKAQHLLGQLITGLSAAVMATAQARGTQSTLEGVAEEITNTMGNFPWASS